MLIFKYLKNKTCNFKRTQETRLSFCSQAMAKTSACGVRTMENNCIMA